MPLLAQASVTRAHNNDATFAQHQSPCKFYLAPPFRSNERLGGTRQGGFVVRT
jgi:hypothetical protein